MTNKRDYAPITYACNGATVDFPFSWKILEKESVVVTLISEEIETTLILGEDYNIDFDEIGGNVKTKTAYATGNSIIVTRNASMYQGKTFSTSSGFQASEVEKAFDGVSINLQDMAYNIENFKEDFSSKINTKIEVFRDDVEKQIESNKQEILGIQSSFEDEVNIKIQQVSDAATKINKLEEAVNTAVTSANIASEKADNAAGETAKAKAEAEKATEQANLATSKANEATEIIENSLADIESKTQEEINKIKQTGFYMQNDKLYYIDSNGETKEFKSGSSGLELCDIGTALYIDETKGLRRRLNGSIMDITSNYQAFLTRLKEITTLYPSLVCTETEWQTTKTMSKLGQCGKFVYNYDTDGTTITSIRLPLVININGLVDMTNAGLIKDESLPNIKDVFSYYPMSGGSSKNYTTSTGLIQGAKVPSFTGGVYYKEGSRDCGISFDASRVSSTYQDNAPVQQEAIQYSYFIQVATGQETENNIVNDIGSNNPFTFGMSQYYKGEMNNISWLKSDGEYHPKATYPSFYNWILTNVNAGKDGFKLSTDESATDYDFRINTADESFRLPLKNGQEGVFASRGKGNGLTLGFTDGTHNIGLGWSQTVGVTGLENYYGNNIGIFAAGSFSIPNGYSIGLTTDPTKSGIVVDTTVPSGYNLYYYVGETVQNANIIDAGRIAEELGNKISKNACKAYVVETYSNGSSWYRLWSDNWLEQGGIFNGASSNLVYLKEFGTVNYNIIVTPSVITTSNTKHTLCRNKTTVGCELLTCEYGHDGATDKNYNHNWYASGYAKG